MRDLRCELEAAYLLLQERRFTVEYERYGTHKARGPDFTVTFKKKAVFHVEVTRLRIPRREADSSDAIQNGEKSTFDGQRKFSRVIDIICGKLGQMQPNSMNVVVLMAESNFFKGIDLTQAMAHLRERAERDEASGFFARHGFIGRRDFFKYYLRLSGVLMRGTGEPGSNGFSALWQNSQAKHPIPANIATILRR
ncbi:MAG: hypothetical protein ACRDIB_09150 [Ardenticatenaceae bacterium]